MQKRIPITKLALQLTDNHYALPLSMLNISRMEVDEHPHAFAAEGCVAVLADAMTAMELIRAAQSLRELADYLMTILADECGSCTACRAHGEKCEAYHDDGGGAIQIPPQLRENANIPADAKLDYTIDPDNGEIRIVQAEYEHDLSDLSPELLKALRENNICMENLQEHLREEDLVYGV